MATASLPDRTTPAVLGARTRSRCFTDANALREALAATLLDPVPQGAPRG